MKCFFLRRFCPGVIIFSLLLSLIVIPAGAFFEEGFRDTGSVADWDAKINNPGEGLLSVLGPAFGVSASAKSVFWAMVDSVVMPKAGEVSLADLNAECDKYNKIFGSEKGYTFWEQLLKGTQQVFSDSFSMLFLGTANLNFTVEKHDSSAFYRIYENTTGLWVVSSSGAYPYCDPSSGLSSSGGDHWIDAISAQSLLGKAKVEVLEASRMKAVATQLEISGELAYVANFGSKYKAIYQDGHKILANSDGYPYVSPADSAEWAVNQSRPDTTVKDESGVVVDIGVEDNSTSIDLSGMTITLPDGSINLIDQLIYDESTKSYHIDSHDTYNYTTNYYYEWNYYINYTSITYIGQTEEYNKCCCRRKMVGQDLVF